MTEIAVKTKGDVMEAVIAKGDLSALTAEQRVAYYKATCESLGLNPLTQPFAYITLNGKLTLYARKDATDQLRAAQSVSITKLERERMDGIYLVTATAQTSDGRQDSSLGAVNVEGLKGDALANAYMKAETKAKRRVTLSICGLGFTDETEIETIPGARPVVVDAETGKIEDEHWTLGPDAQGNFEAYLYAQEIDPDDFYKFAGKAFADLPDKPATMKLVKGYQAASKQE